MSRHLLILRHAKSAWDSETATDFERPLAKRGQRDAPRMGQWLSQQDLIPDYVVSSPALRAKQTTLKVCEATKIDATRLHWDNRIYEASPGTLLQVLANCPESAPVVLLVGHNPGLELLLRYLCDDIPFPADGKLLPTATLAHVAMPDDWIQLDPRVGRLRSLIRPRSLVD
jgi:phosphohistidine phosphatase